MTRGILPAAALLCCSLWGGIAGAHEAVSGWTYDAECCASRDCAPIPSSAVHVTSEGYLVQLSPGDHPEITGPFERLVPWDQVRDSGDGEYHACIRTVIGGWTAETRNTISREVRCLYVPPAGS